MPVSIQRGDELVDNADMRPVAIFRHSPGEGPGYFATFLDHHALPWQLWTIDAGEPVPTDPAAFSGLAFMGGPMSVNDSLPWIAQECSLITQAVAQDIPVLGHCLGGQLLAKAMGAKVGQNPVKEIGWGMTRVADNATARTWFDGASDILAFHWHGETFSLPAGATRILESRHCANQAFVLGQNLGLQCHVEMTLGMIENWCAIGGEEIAASTGPGVQQAADMLANMSENLKSLHAVADRLYGRWIAGLKST